MDAAGFGGLSVSAKGHTLVQGQTAFRYRPDLVRTSRKENRETLAKSVTNPHSDALLTRLKALRLKLAKARSVPAYLIFSDRSLIDMASRVPLTKWDFGEVNGVGAAKQEQFGEIFINEIKSFVQEKSSPA